MEASRQQMRVIAGSGRSGTTWVLDCLADANALRPMFEPLHPAVTPLGRKYAHRLLMPGERHPDLEAYLDRIHRGAYSSWWVTYRGRRDLLLPNGRNLRSLRDAALMYRRWRAFLHDRAALRAASRRQGTLVKRIRGNLALGWMTRTLGARAILLMRHPCAVVESQSRLGQIWDPAPILQRFRTDTRLEEASGGRYRKWLETRLTLIESLLLIWVIENQIPVERALQYGYPVIPYETLADDAEQPWKHICASLGLATLPEEARVRKPSQQSSDRRAAGSSMPVSKPRWMTGMHADDLRKIQRILDDLDCNLYDVTQEAPLRNRS